MYHVSNYLGTYTRYYLFSPLYSSVPKVPEQNSWNSVPEHRSRTSSKAELQIRLGIFGTGTFNFLGTGTELLEFNFRTLSSELTKLLFLIMIRFEMAQGEVLYYI